MSWNRPLACLSIAVFFAASVESGDVLKYFCKYENESGFSIDAGYTNLEINFQTQDLIGEGGNTFVNAWFQEWKLVDGERPVVLIKGTVTEVDHICCDQVDDGDFNFFLEPADEDAFCLRAHDGTPNDDGKLEIELNTDYGPNRLLAPLEYFPPESELIACGWWVEDHGHDPTVPGNLPNPNPIINRGKTELHPPLYLLRENGDGNGLRVLAVRDRSVNNHFFWKEPRFHLLVGKDLVLRYKVPFKNRPQVVNLSKGDLATGQGFAISERVMIDLISYWPGETWPWWEATRVDSRGSCYPTTNRLERVVTLPTGVFHIAPYYYGDYNFEETENLLEVDLDVEVGTYHPLPSPALKISFNIELPETIARDYKHFRWWMPDLPEYPNEQPGTPYELVVENTDNPKLQGTVAYGLRNGIVGYDQTEFSFTLFASELPFDFPQAQTENDFDIESQVVENRILADQVVIRLDPTTVRLSLLPVRADVSDSGVAVSHHQTLSIKDIAEGLNISRAEAGKLVDRFDCVPQGIALQSHLGVDVKASIAPVHEFVSSEIGWRILPTGSQLDPIEEIEEAVWLLNDGDEAEVLGNDVFRRGDDLEIRWAGPAQPITVGAKVITSVGEVVWSFSDIRPPEIEGFVWYPGGIALGVGKSYICIKDTWIHKVISSTGKAENRSGELYKTVAGLPDSEREAVSSFFSVKMGERISPDRMINLFRALRDQIQQDTTLKSQQDETQGKKQTQKGGGSASRHREE